MVDWCHLSLCLSKALCTFLFSALVCLVTPGASPLPFFRVAVSHFPSLQNALWSPWLAHFKTRVSKSHWSILQLHLVSETNCSGSERQRERHAFICDVKASMRWCFNPLLLLCVCVRTRVSIHAHLWWQLVWADMMLTHDDLVNWPAGIKPDAD